MMRSFDLVGTIHGREYSDHGEFVTADDYYHLQLYSEAVDRLKLRMEEDLEQQKNLISSLRAELTESYSIDDNSDLLAALIAITNSGPDAIPIKEAFEMAHRAIERASGGKV